jgi:hypothetical protein
MASVREELINFLVDEYDSDKESAEKAVDNAIAANGDDEDFGSDIEQTAEHIYSAQTYWR